MPILPIIGVSPLANFLVGDLIMNVRSLGPDAPIGLLPTPIAGVPTAVPVAGTLPAGTYFVVVTQVNPWGETLGSAEQSVTIGGANNGFTITANPAIGATGIKIYIGDTSGQQNRYALYTVNSGIIFGVVNNFTFTNNNVVQGVPPVNSSAFLPDTDGSFVSANTMYRWMNDALRAASRIAGGIQDSVGVASISGERRYVVPGQWIRFNQCFYDGWELDLGNKAETFRNRNLTANIAISLMVDAQSNTTRIELYWTPSRTSGVATTTADMLSNAASMAITTPTGWLLEDGFAQITDTVHTEVFSYSEQTSNALQNCIRGWAGTEPFGFATGSQVKELNIEINGYRMPNLYPVGSSLTTLNVPPGWEPFLKDYLLGTFREAEQESQEAQGLKDRAAKNLEAWLKSNKPVAGPRQMRMYGDYGLRGTVPGGLTGPLIIP